MRKSGCQARLERWEGEEVIKAGVDDHRRKRKDQLSGHNLRKTERGRVEQNKEM